MDDLVTQIIDYLPVSYANANEEEYIQFLFKAARDNYQTENWQFSYFALHLAFMWYIYTQIWKIKHVDDSRFQLAIILHDYDKVIKPIIKAVTPADYHTLPETQVMHFLRLIIDEELRIREFKKAVLLRNDLAHCNFLIKVDTYDVLQNNVLSMIEKMEEIQIALNPLLEKMFTEFIKDSIDVDIREYSLIEDQVREVLIHKNYLSRKDLIQIMSTSISDEAVCREIKHTIEKLYFE